jgi:hypothetical protein
MPMATTLKPIPGLEGTEFETPPNEELKVVYSLEGEPKTGKSTYPFFGPGPQAVLDIDDRLDGVVNKWLRGEFEGHPAKRIDRLPLALPKVDLKSRATDQSVLRQAEAEWRRFLDHFRKVGKSSRVPGGVRVLSIDNATGVRNLRLMAEFGRLSSIPQTARGQANLEMGALMRESRKFGCSVVWIHELKNEYGMVKTVDDQGNTVNKRDQTGNRILDGYDKTHYCVDVMLRTGWDGRKKLFTVQVIQSGLNAKTNGKVYTEEDWDELGPFAFISSLQRPRTNPLEWRDPMVEED